MRIHPIFHVSLLDKTNNPISEKDENVINEYEVEKILRKRVKKGTTQYLVKWKGYSSSENTWEPTENLHCPDVCCDYCLNMNPLNRVCVISALSSRCSECLAHNQGCSHSTASISPQSLAELESLNSQESTTRAELINTINSLNDCVIASEACTTQSHYSSS